MLPRPLGDPTFRRSPIRWPARGAHLQTQIQQIKGASQPSRLSPTGVTQLASQNMPKSVIGLSVTVHPSGSQRSLIVSFIRAPDVFFNKVNVYLRQGTQPPVLIAASPISPINVSLPKSQSPSVIIVQSEGNWGPIPLSKSPSQSVRLA